MKYKKSIGVFVILVFFMTMIIPIKSRAATFEEVNDPSMFLKQEGNSTCTLASATMMLRRTALMSGNSEWNNITENMVRGTAWINGEGLKKSFSYNGIAVAHNYLPTGNANIPQLISLLDQHPEGIVLYYWSGSKQHAVLLTDYTDGIFYCSDPYGNSPVGRIPLDQALYVRATNARAYWYVSYPDVTLSPSLDHSVDIGTDFYAYIINTPAWKPLTNDSYNVSIREGTGSANQVWKFDRDGDGAYKITNCQDGNVLDVHNFGSADGTNVAVAASNDSSAQRWYIYGESGAYYLKAKCSDLVLDIAGGSAENGSNVQMWTKNDTPAQNFQIWKLNRPDASTIHCASGTNYTPTSIWWTETNNTTSYNVKIWKDFVGNGEPYKCIFGLRDKSCTIELPEGNYEAYVDSCNSFSFTQSQNTIKFNVQNGVPLDIGNDFYAAVLINKNWLNLTNVNGNVQLEAGDSVLSARQTWHFLRQGDGTYHILNCLDGKALDVYNFIDEEGTNVQVCDFNGSDAQRWYIYGRGSGEYYIQPKFANKVLDVCGGNNNPGDNIQIWTSNYTDAQKFAVYELNVAQSIRLNSKEERLKIGDSCQLIASLMPEDAVDKKLTWSSNDPEIAEVDENGCVKAVEAGKATITAASITGQKAECEIVVETIAIKGDLNNNGRVDIMDARKAKRAAMKETNLTDNELTAADLNRDGKVDIMEARKIKRAAMKEIIL